MADTDKEQLEPPTRHREHREENTETGAYLSPGQQPKIETTSGQGSVPKSEVSPKPAVPGATPKGASATKRSLLKSRATRVWALIVTLVTLATGVISVFPILFKDESSAQSLKISMKPFRPDTVSHYALPVGAPIDSFPLGGPLCTSEQEAWLNQHGTRFQRDYILDFRNSAGGGSSLAVGNIHGAQEASIPADPAYIVECDKSGDGGVVAEPGRLLLDSGEGAFFDKTAFGAAGTGQPNTPLAYNLRPGETGQVVLSFAARSNFKGQVVTSVSVGDQTTDIKIPLVGENEVIVPGVVSPRTILVTVQNGTLKCNVVPNPTAQVNSCDVHDIFRKP